MANLADALLFLFLFNFRDETGKTSSISLKPRHRTPCSLQHQSDIRFAFPTPPKKDEEQKKRRYMKRFHKTPQPPKISATDLRPVGYADPLSKPGTVRGRGDDGFCLARCFQFPIRWRGLAPQLARGIRSRDVRLMYGVFRVRIIQISFGECGVRRTGSRKPAECSRVMNVSFSESRSYELVTSFQDCCRGPWSRQGWPRTQHSSERFRYRGLAKRVSNQFGSSAPTY